MKYTIKAGCHYANKLLRQRIMFGNTLKFKFSISSSALYAAQVNNGWSKVFGIAEPLPHRNSCRLAFKCDGGVMSVGIYCYVGGVSPQQDQSLKWEMMTISPGHDYMCVIFRTRDQYIICVEDPSDFSFMSTAIVKANRWRLPFRLLAHPYIGGSFTLNRDVNIYIEIL